MTDSAPVQYFVPNDEQRNFLARIIASFAIEASKANNGNAADRHTFEVEVGVTFIVAGYRMLRPQLTGPVETCLETSYTKDASFGLFEIAIDAMSMYIGKEGMGVFEHEYLPTKEAYAALGLKSSNDDLLHVHPKFEKLVHMMAMTEFALRNVREAVGLVGDKELDTSNPQHLAYLHIRRVVGDVIVPFIQGAREADRVIEGLYLPSALEQKVVERAKLSTDAAIGAIAGNSTRPVLDAKIPNARGPRTLQ